MTSSLYPLGKLPQADLVDLLSHTIGAPDPRVILGPGLGRDAAVINFGDRCLIAKSDPITFATDEIGWYAIGGIEIEATEGMSLFAEYLYRDTEATVEDDDLDEIDEEADIDLSGSTINIGLMFRW